MPGSLPLRALGPLACFLLCDLGKSQLSLGRGLLKCIGRRCMASWEDGSGDTQKPDSVPYTLGAVGTFPL